MDCDKILPNLYVGSYPRSAGDIDRLKAAGITAVLNLQTDDDFNYLGVDWPALRARYFALGFEVRRVPIRDFDDADLRDKLPEAVRALSDLVEQGHRGMFVHCSGGVNRSPSVVICYLHWVRAMSLDEATRVVQNHHPCAPVMEVIRLATRDRGL